MTVLELISAGVCSFFDNDGGSVVASDGTPCGSEGEPGTRQCLDNKCLWSPVLDGAQCVPATCESLGRSCGETEDGCGNVLNCGSCSGICNNGVCDALGIEQLTDSGLCFIATAAVSPSFIQF